MIRCKYLFLGHHKCSSSYVKSIFADVAFYLNRSIKETDTSETLSKFINEKLDFFLLLNSNKSLVEGNFFDLDNTKCVHVVRDPRDVIISAYFSHLHSHPTDAWPELISQRVHLKSLDKTAGIKAEMDFAQRFLDDINSWDFVNGPNIMHVKMEDFTIDPFSKWLEIFEFMEIVESGVNPRSLSKQAKWLLDEMLSRFLGSFNLVEGKRLTLGQALEIIYNNRYESKSNGRKPGEENLMHHYRKGVPGDWKNYFDAELKDYFKKRYGNILLKYGYEKDNDW